jgi:hypothetical protein
MNGILPFRKLHHPSGIKISLFVHAFKDGMLPSFHYNIPLGLNRGNE